MPEMIAPRINGLIVVFALLGMILVIQPSMGQSENHLTIGEMSLKSWPNPFKPSLADQEGTPYLYDDWLPGIIHSVKGKEYDDIKLKFNLFHGRLLVKISEEAQPRMMVPIHIKSFSIMASDTTYTFYRHLVPVREQKKPMDPFFIEMASGDYFLLAKPGKQAQRESKNVLAHVDEQHNVRYVDIEDYFIENPAGNIIPFKNSKKVKAQIFGEDLPDLEKYAKQNKLKWGKASDLARIIRQANQL